MLRGRRIRARIAIAMSEEIYRVRLSFLVWPTSLRGVIQSYRRRQSLELMQTLAASGFLKKI